MASINMANDKAWVGAAWVLRSIAERLQRYGHFPSLAQGFAAVAAGVQYLDITDLSGAEQAELRRVVPLIVGDVKKGGPALLDGPEFYAGFLAAYEELEQLVGETGSRE